MVNFLVDTAVIFVVAYIASEIWNWYVFHWRYPYFKFGWIFAAVLFIYYTVFEALTGRSLGKMLSYTHVVNRQNRRPGFLQILLRSLVRLTIIDPFFIPFLDKPLHDYLSKTEVVEK